MAWLVFMAASWFLFSHTARNFFVDRAKKDLLAETETVEKQIGEMAQSDLFTERDDGNILAGIIMTLEGVVRVGDDINYNNEWMVVMSIGVRTTRLKWYGDLRIVRNNDLKNFINYTASNSDMRILIPVCVDLRESLERVEQVIERELPGIRDRVGEKVGTKIKRIEYRGVTSITANGMELSFAIFTQPWCYNYVKFAMTREVKLMCDRNNIRIALPRVVVQEPGPQAPADPE